jgi:hypothetical protein
MARIWGLDYSECAREWALFLPEDFNRGALAVGDNKIVGSQYLAMLISVKEEVDHGQCWSSARAYWCSLGLTGAHLKTSAQTKFVSEEKPPPICEFRHPNTATATLSDDA